MLRDSTILIFYITVNLIALVMTLIAWKRPAWGRVLFALNFLGAGLFNLGFAYADPEEFLYYAEFAIFEGYQKFILGTFSDHLEYFLTLIAAAQVVVGIAYLGKGRVLQAAALAGIFFLVAIAPLGVGAAFPATLTLAAGSYLLYRHAGKEGDTAR